MCVFFSPILPFSSRVLSDTGAGVCVLPPSFLLLCLRLKLALYECVSRSDSRFLGTRFLGDWNSAPPPSLSSLPFP